MSTERQQESPWIRDGELARARDLLRDARRLVVLTGAGVSTESGIPDFRSPGGVWSRFDPDEFHIERFRADPVRFWRERAKLMEALDLAHARPNPAHEAVARASRSSRFLGHVTQNIDGLFLRAAHAEDKLVEIHGSAAKVRCVACLRFFPFESARADLDAGRLPPRCAACGGVLKPGTVLFGEELPEDAMARASGWTTRADALLVAGTSLQVHPVAALPALALARGARIVIVNRDATDYDEDADAVVREAVSVALPALLAGLAQQA